MNNENNIKGLNPFLPFGIYTADGEPKVFGNRVYLYGSNDLFDGGYCSKEYHVYSAPVDDLTDWTDHGISFTTDAVPWSDAVLYAPDALLYNGVYYLFFCLSDGSEGVAQSNRPEGPFVNARRITLDGQPITGIDPSVLE
ncbi:MAG: family 43 glycosylhydrolase, partial [Clostridia bacterium]|nr:family 43 glycosylhydrolase [Clostridia bacterium]